MAKKLADPGRSRRKPSGAKKVVLKNPVSISEDEADTIISLRRLREPTVTFKEYLRKRGYALNR